MDYSMLSRKELQALCKKSGIPANTSNAYMAEALCALKNAPEDCKALVMSIPNLAELVKSARRPTRSIARAVKVEASEVDDLSSKLARSTILNGISFEEMQRNWRSAISENVPISNAAKVTSSRVGSESKTSVKVELVSPIRLHILDDSVPPKTRVTSGASPGFPTPEVANDAISTQGIPQQAVGEAAKGCQHRTGRKIGSSCKSCAFEKRVANIMQDMLKNLNIPKVASHLSVELLKDCSTLKSRPSLGPVAASELP